MKARQGCILGTTSKKIYRHFLVEVMDVQSSTSVIPVQWHGSSFEEQQTVQVKKPQAVHLARYLAGKLPILQSPYSCLSILEGNIARDMILSRCENCGDVYSCIKCQRDYQNNFLLPKSCSNIEQNNSFLPKRCENFEENKFLLKRCEKEGQNFLPQSCDRVQQSNESLPQSCKDVEQNNNLLPTPCESLQQNNNARSQRCANVHQEFATKAKGYQVVDRQIVLEKFFLIAVHRRFVEDGFSVVKNLFSIEDARKARNEIGALYKIPGKFTPGKLRQKALNTTRSLGDIRGDSVMWVDMGNDEATCISQVAKQLNKLALSMYNLKGIEMTRVSKSKIMVSCYNGGGTAYKRHIDSSTEGNLKLTFIFYFNESCTEKDGGCLRIHKDSGHVDIPPEFGTLVIFRSDKLVHEVLPTYSQRFALTIWYMEVPKRKMFVQDETMEMAQTSSVVQAPKICVQKKRIKLEHVE